MRPAKKTLELQSDRIEMVLATHKAPARVTGGVVTPRAIQFQLAPAIGTKINKLQGLADELALALGAVSVRISRQGSNIQVEVPRDDAEPVKLLSLISQLAKSGSDRISPATAVLGLCDDGAPLLMRLASPDVAHVLVAGTTGSGKTALCQTLVLSLALTHRRSHLQFVLIDPKRRAFAPFAALPHLLWPAIDDAGDAADALGELVGLMETRDRAGAAGAEGSCSPRIVVVLDELADLMAPGGTRGASAGKVLGERLTRLAQRGREAGIHVIGCTQKPSSQVLGGLMRANFPVRLVGKVVSPEDARVAAGVGGTGAEKLCGRGDFLAVASGQVLRFQAAYISPAEVKQVVAQLCGGAHRRDAPVRHPGLFRQAASLVARSN